MHSTTHRLAALALAAGLLAARAAPGHSQIVRLPADDRPLAGAPTDVFTVGAEEGESWEMLSNVRSVAFDRNDNLYVLDLGNQRVLMFDRTGKFVRQMGRQGDGPGELQFPLAMAVKPDGTVLVYEPTRRSYSVFGPDGAFQRTIASSEEWWPSPQGGILGVHPGGGVLTPMRESPLQGRRTGAELQAVTTTTSIPLMLDPLDGRSAPRKVFEIPQYSETRQVTPTQQPGQNRMVLRMQQPRVFAPQVLWGMLPGGNAALSFTTGYTVRVVDMEGKTLRYIQRPLRPRLVTEEDRQREIKEREERQASGQGRVVFGGGGGAGSSMRLDMPPPEFADTMPVLRRMAVAPTGRIWVGRTGRWWNDQGLIDLITPEGEYLGTLTGQRMPDAVSASGLAAYIVRDELDVEQVVVRRLPAAWR